MKMYFLLKKVDFPSSHVSFGRCLIVFFVPDLFVFFSHLFRFPGCPGADGTPGPRLLPPSPLRVGVQEPSGPHAHSPEEHFNKKDSAGVLVDGTCCPLAALILKNSSVSHVFFQQINYKGYILLVLPPEWLCTTNPPKWWRPKAKNLQRSKRKNAAKSQKNNWVTQQLMVQKSGKENQLRLVRVVEIPLFTTVLAPSKRWVGMGFLKHQQ